MAIDFEELASGGMSADQLANVFLREYYCGKEIIYPINPFQMLTDLKIAFLLRPFKSTKEFTFRQKMKKIFQ